VCESAQRRDTPQNRSIEILCELENLFRPSLVETVPLGFERVLVDLVDPKYRQWHTFGMFEARRLDLEYGLRGLSCELADELQFGVGKCLHRVILIEINADIGPHLSGTRGINNTIGCVRKRPGGNRWSS
jgi:hypothetical protein